MDKSPTIPNKDEIKRLDPLGELPAVNHLLPEEPIFKKDKTEPGAKPLNNKRHETFCTALTGWGASGIRIENYKAYEIAYGKTGATARSESTHLLARPEVAARVKYLEKLVGEAKRHDYLAAQHEIDELRLGVIARARTNSKLMPMALIAARDFEKAHGLEATPTTTTVEETQEIAGANGVIPGILASLKRVVRTTTKGEQ